MLILMLLLILLVFNRVGLLHDDLEEVVYEHTYYTQDVYRMLEVARKRSLALHRVVFDEDPFERDAQMMRFYALATEFGAARQRIGARKLSEEEKAAVAVLNSAVPRTLAAQQKVINLVQASRMSEAGDALFKEAIPAQLEVYDTLNSLVQLQQQEIKVS